MIAIAVNWVDAPLLLLVGIAAYLGGRGGLLARLISWVGVALGLYFGMLLTPDAMSAIGGSSASFRVVVAIAFLIFMTMVGESCGTLLTRWWRARRGTELDFDPRRAAGDRVAGAVAGVVAFATIIWMMIPSAGFAPGWTARSSRSSFLVDVIDQLFPPQSQRMVHWGRTTADEPYPGAIPPTDDGPPVPSIPTRGLPDAVKAQALKSLVKVTGEACGQVETGTGFVLEKGFVATNAHVVAGQTETTVIDLDSTEYRADVVAFDPRQDVAILSVPDLAASPFKVGVAQAGAPGAFLGFPGGGSVAEAPAAMGDIVAAKGTDIFHKSEILREVLAVGARLVPGFSGAPFVSEDGTVMGMAFAADPAKATRAYALTGDDVRGVYNRRKARPVGAGRCLYE